MNPKTRTARFASRRGSAPIELIMWLPLLMFVFWIILAAGHLFLINCEVVVETRQMAWQGRHEPWRQGDGTYEEGEIPALHSSEAGRGLADLSQVANRYFQDNEDLPGDWSAKRGFLTARHSKVVPFTPALFSNMRIARSEHFVLGGVWDQREMPFEDRSEHKRLEPSEKFQYYFANPHRHVNFASLKQLASLGGVGQSSGSTKNPYQGTLPEKSKQLSRERQKILSAITDTKDEIERYEQQLQALRAETQPDEGAIAHVEADLAAAKDRLNRLDAALAKVENSIDIQNKIRQENAKRDGKEQ